MDRLLAAAAVVGVLLLVIALMARRLRAMTGRGAAIGAPAAPPADPGDTVLDTVALHVATTIAGEPLERVIVPGLGIRGRGRVTVTATGIVLAVPGEPPVFLPRASILGAGPGTWAIDRAVEPGGLVVVTWQLSGTALDTYLRAEESEPLLRALDDLRPAPAASADPSADIRRQA